MIEKRLSKSSAHPFNSTGNLYALGQSQHHHDDDPPRVGATVVEAFSHAKLSSPRTRNRQLLALFCFLVFATVTSSDFRNGNRPHLRGGKKQLQPPSEHTYYLGGATRPGYFREEDAILRRTKGEFRFAAITDLDQKSRHHDPTTTNKPPIFKAMLLPGVLKQRRRRLQDSSSAGSGDNNNNNDYYEIVFEQEREILTRHNEYGRGAEFSELQLFDNRLFSFDDRTGEIVEILNSADGTSSTVVPRFVLTENDTNKGMKLEWATVKDDELYIGSIGKELTHEQDFMSFTSEAGMRIAVMNQLGQIRRVDWTFQYNFVRLQLFADLPGYVVHEAVHWSHHLQKWVFLPRRISKQPYSPEADERLGSNKILLVDEQFTTSETVTIEFQKYKEENNGNGGLHGFSSFAFVPQTKDRHVLATRSVEEGCFGDGDNCQQRTYFCVFDIITGELLMDEVLYHVPLKFEGVEFVDMFTIPPRFS